MNSTSSVRVKNAPRSSTPAQCDSSRTASVTEHIPGRPGCSSSNSDWSMRSFVKKHHCPGSSGRSSLDCSTAAWERDTGFFGEAGGDRRESICHRSVARTGFWLLDPLTCDSQLHLRVAVG